MGAGFPPVGANPYPPEPKEHAFILADELQKLQQSEAFVGNKPMPTRIYTPMVTAMLKYLQKARNDTDKLTSMAATLTVIKEHVQNTEQKAVAIYHKMDTTRSATSSATTGYKQTQSWAQKAGAEASSFVLAASIHTSSTAPASVQHSFAKAREVICKLQNKDLSNDLKKLTSQQLRDRVHASIVSEFSNQNKQQRVPQIVAARILPSGDLLITGTEMEDTVTLRNNEKWARKISSTSKILRPTYGAVAHGISLDYNIATSEGMQRTILKIQQQNELPANAGIEYLEWLVKRPHEGKTCGSMIIHFNSEVDCNKVLIRKLVLDSRLFDCIRHIPEARIKQCFNCGKYGHMSLACRYDTTCFRCAGKHSYKDCKETPKCASCKGKHITSSDTCSDRKREKARVQRVREEATAFWPTGPSVKVSGPQQMEAQTGKEGDSVTEGSAMEVPSLVVERPERVELGPRSHQEEREEGYQVVARGKQGDNKRKRRSSNSDEALQPRSTNIKLAKPKKLIKGTVQIYEDGENGNISSQRSTRSGRALSSSAKLRENMQQQQDAQYTQEEQL